MTIPRNAEAFRGIFYVWDCGGTLVGADPLIGLPVFPMTRVDVGIDPYEFFRGFRKNRGIVTGGNPRRGRTSVSDTLRWQVGKHWDYGLPHQCEHWFAMTTSISVRTGLRG